MSKYGTIAIRATETVQSGQYSCPISAWKIAAEEIFPPEQKASREKGCPRYAFLGLAEEGLIRGIPSGRYTSSVDNKEYARLGVELLVKSPNFSNHPEKMWERIMCGKKKVHNDQMFVVADLWNKGYIVTE